MILENALDKLNSYKRQRISCLFDDDPHRFEEFSLWHENDLLCDFSKTHLCHKTRNVLLNLARECQIKEKINDLFNGGIVNTSENLPALHTALRHIDISDNLFHNNTDISNAIKKEYQRLSRFCNNVRKTVYRSFNGKPFTDIIHIGIGGSHIATQMAQTALHSYHDGPPIHYLNNIDATSLKHITDTLDLAQSLIVVSSKTFRTDETIHNAKTLINILHNRYPHENIKHNLVGLCSHTNTHLAKGLGIPDDNIFNSFDWVGGRYSLWSSHGLSLMLAIGETHFKALLNGAAAIDTHFKMADIHNNIPIILALIDIWHRSFCNYNARIIVPYADNLRYLPQYLQQLVMESNGKHLDRHGYPLTQSPCALVFGDIGTSAQHSIFQYLHQGTTVIPCEFFIGAQNIHPEYPEHDTKLLANALSQAYSLAFGNASSTQHTHAEAYLEGNRPSIMHIYKKLTPYILGKIMAINEHRTFVEGCIYNINSFDQWGVEGGKEMALHIGKRLNRTEKTETPHNHTIDLIEAIQKMCDK